MKQLFCSLGKTDVIYTCSIVIPDRVLHAISEASLPCFIYDADAVAERASLASSLVDRCFFPVKACPEPDVLRAVVAAGCGLDLCSAGDLELACAVGCPPHLCKFTSACADDWLLLRLWETSIRLDADSLNQALRWGTCGGKACGLRMAAARPNTLYGPKFGIPAAQIPATFERLAEAGIRVEGLHLHDLHANLTPLEFPQRLIETFSQLESEFLRRCAYVNIGGSWPMRHSIPASSEDLRNALKTLRDALVTFGFSGALYAEPGRWVVGPCGYWAAQVAAVKPHPTCAEHCVIVLDTSTPVPCRPSLSPFLVLRHGILLNSVRALTCDIFGSANTALDTLGTNVRLPALAPGDVVVSLGQGAYTRTLIPPFNERGRPDAVVIKGA